MRWNPSPDAESRITLREKPVPVEAHAPEIDLRLHIEKMGMRNGHLQQDGRLTTANLSHVPTNG
jgi:hypothetical protein